MRSFTGWEHVRRVTLCLLLVFAAFAATRLILFEKVHSEPYRDYHRILATDFAVDALHARWGLDLLVVPIVAVAILIVCRRDLADVIVAFALGLVVAIGMAFFPTAVMSGYVKVPALLHGADAGSSFVRQSLAYAAVVVAVLVIANRIAAHITSSSRSTPAPAARMT